MWSESSCCTSVSVTAAWHASRVLHSKRRARQQNTTTSKQQTTSHNKRATQQASRERWERRTKAISGKRKVPIGAHLMQGVWDESWVDHREKGRLGSGVVDAVGWVNGPQREPPPPGPVRTVTAQPGPLHCTAQLSTYDNNQQGATLQIGRAALWGAASAAGGAAVKGEGACANSQQGQPRHWQEERATCLGRLTSYLSWLMRHGNPGIMLECLQPRKVQIERSRQSSRLVTVLPPAPLFRVVAFRRHV